MHVDMDGMKLRKVLRNSGLSKRAIDAAWPSWWSDDANKSPSARAELCFAVARKLGLSPKSLFDERVEFVWRDHARFKHVRTESEVEREALESFGVSLGRMLVSMTPLNTTQKEMSAGELRRTILKHHQFVDLRSLLVICWALGIPVVYLQVFPLPTKSMHAMVVRTSGRYAVLLGRDSKFPALVSFTLAHEIGHLMLGHLVDGAAIVDLEDSGTDAANDPEEWAANEYALTLLTGSAEPRIKPDTSNFGPLKLAKAVLNTGPGVRIEPGILAMCYAFQSGEWAKGMASLKYISEAKPVWKEVNKIAARELDWSAVSDDTGDYVRVVMGCDNA